jgi:3-dehydroquinate synthase
MISCRSGACAILVGERLQNLPAHLPDCRPIIVTDANVGGLYRENFPPAAVITLTAGESSKSLAVVKDIYGQLLDLEADRSSFIVAVGGGVVCDVAGFVASTYMRGVRFGFVATSLLAQVDAAVGGKNGVNFGGYKNLVGTFNQPAFVICDLSLLKTLPEKELRCGLAEVVKHALIKDAALLTFLENNGASIRALEPGVIERLVTDSVAIKSAVVNQDEKESGQRRILNFGHTFGHALEHLLHLSHGEAVSIGMVMAAEISVNRGLMSAADAARIRRLLKSLALPTCAEADPDHLIAALRKDKKRESDRLHYVLLCGIGKAVVEAVPLGELKRHLRQVLPRMR